MIGSEKPGQRLKIDSVTLGTLALYLAGSGTNRLKNRR